jgi:hypothetical protein
MPYIKEDRRNTLDHNINELVLYIKMNVNDGSNPYATSKLTNEQFLDIAGDINYSVSRLVSRLMGEVSYGKIAIITGVLENIKQEFYRRVAENYEEKKITENGDIIEYKVYK